MAQLGRSRREDEVMGFDVNQFEGNLHRFRNFILDENNKIDNQLLIILYEFVENVIGMAEELETLELNMQEWKRRHHELLTSYNQKYGEAVSKELLCHSFQKDQKND